jgi:hypothetical protein
MRVETIFPVSFIGQLAFEALELNPAGEVMGITTKGIFLSSGDRVLFITDAPYKSPFNIYVNQFEIFAAQMKIRDAFIYNSTLSEIMFPRQQMRLEFRSPEIWSPEGPVEITTSLPERKMRLNVILDDFLKREPGKGWLFLHSVNQAGISLDNLQERISLNSEKFTICFTARDLEGCLAAAGKLVGLGGGLTPSGDDWLTGFLLYQVRREQSQGLKDPFLKDLCERVITLAFDKTTMISASRLIAAARGMAEQPFISLIDYLFDQNAKVVLNLIDILFNFGHSSGVDTCMGIAAAIE